MIKYLAGIFDAEGYVRIRRTNLKSYTPECKIYMCNERVVKLFAKRYNLEVKSDLRGINRQKAYYVTLGVKQLKSSKFIEELLPYLNEKKKQLQEIDYLLKGTKDKETCYQDYMKAKECFDHPLSGELDFEYIAGVVDGDGWFTMFNADRAKGESIMNRFFIGLEQRYKPMVDYMLKFGGHVTIRKVKDRRHHRQTYEWKTGMRTMLALLEKIEPYLIEKRQKCQDFIRYIKKCNELDNLSKELLKQKDESRLEIKR